MKRKLDYRKSININEDIWFYPNKHSFDFVVWGGKIGNKRQVVQFTLTHRKIRKFFTSK